VRGLQHAVSALREASRQAFALHGPTVHDLLAVPSIDQYRHLCGLQHADVGARVLQLSTAYGSALARFHDDVDIAAVQQKDTSASS
jgi:hypothetical protein